MAARVRDLRYLFEAEYDFVFFQEVGEGFWGVHRSVKVAATNQPNLQASRRWNPTS